MQRILKRISSCILAIIMCLGITAVVNSSSQIIVADAAEDNYYSSITATSGNALLGQLHDLMVRTHKTYTSYNDCKAPAKVMQTDPGTANNTVRDFYTQKDISSTWDGNRAGTWNREHVWCQSLSNGLWGTSGGGSDMHHIRPSEVRLNGTRGNNTYGDVGGENGGSPAYYIGTDGSEMYVGGYTKGDSFEPLPQVKGDVARIVMYVYMHYNKASNVGGSSSDNSYFGNLTFTKIMTPSSESAAISLLLKWNKDDPVDDIERTRNEAVAEIQGNRNPFIDNSSYAEAIWGGGTVNPNPDTPVLKGLTLSPSTLSLKVGESEALTVTANPDNASNSVTWTSSNPTVATVAGGTVTAKVAGTATITATSTVDKTIKATATVTVTKATTPAPTPGVSGSITIDASKFNLFSGYDFYKWQSDGVEGIAYIYGGTDTVLQTTMQFNKSKDSYYLASTSAMPQAIRSVTVKTSPGADSKDREWKLLTSTSAYGEVKGKPTDGNDRGTKTVTQSGVTWTVDGNDTYFALTYELDADAGVCYLDSIVVEYGDNSATLTGLTLSPSTLSLNVGESKALTVTATPGNASKEVTWTSSNSAVASVENGKVTANVEGTATITATSTVDPTIRATASVTVTKAADVKPEPETSKTVTIDLSKFNLTDNYGFKNWSSGGIGGIAYIYGGNSSYPADSGMQFNRKQSSYYLASNIATPGPIKSVTVKAFSGKFGNDWKLLTSTSAYGEVAGKPTNGNDHGNKTIAKDGTATWSVSGNDTYFALTYETDGFAANLDSIIVEYEVNQGGGDVPVDPPVDPSVELENLTMNLPSCEITEGNTIKLSVTGEPANADASVSWTSSDESVATVDKDGLVTAVKAGTVTITATSKENPEITATCKITVKAEGVIPTPPTPTVELKSLTMDNDGCKFAVGNTIKLSVTGEPANADASVTWSSSDETVATVSADGTVTAVAAGTATITATSIENPEIKATCTVTVVASGEDVDQPPPDTPAELESLTMNKTTCEVTVDNTVKLYVTATPAEADASVTWSSSDETVATVSADGTVTALKPGKATITATSTVNSSVKATCTVTVKAEEEIPPVENTKVKAFHDAVEAIVSDGTLAERLGFINKAIAAYNALSARDLNEATADVDKLKAAIAEYKKDVYDYNQSAQKTEQAAWGGR